MTNHPNRRARGGPSPSGLLLRELRERAGLTQAQAGALVRVSEIAWRSWENGARRMPAPAMELLCIVLAVGTVARGPYVPPGEWMRPWEAARPGPPGWTEVSGGHLRPTGRESE